MTLMALHDDSDVNRGRHGTAAAAEFERFARDLNERIVSRLSGAALELLSLAATRDEPARGQLLDCVERLDETISSVRRIVAGDVAPEPG